MKQLKTITLALVAIAALSALTATTASATIGQFVNKTGGTVKGVIKVKAITSQVLETLAGVKVTCTSASGEAEAKNTMLIVQKNVIFGVCTKSTGGKCKTAGAGPEEIVIGELHALVVQLDEKGLPGKDSLLVTLVKEVEFECAEVKEKVKGGGQFIASASPENTLTTKFTLGAECASAGMQKPTSYFEFGKLLTIPEPQGLLTKIASGAFEGSCQSGTAEATLAEEGELI